MKIENMLVLLFRILSISIIIICLCLLYQWHQNNIANDSIKEELDSFAKFVEEEPLIENNNEQVKGQPEESLEPTLIVDFEGLKAKNPDTIGWVKVNNTNIDYSVVQSTDNNYYLKRNFNKQSNGAGWIYADYRCTFDDLSKNTLIYGHNRRNGTMFSNMHLMLDRNWFNDESNRKFYFSTQSNNYIAEVFSFYSIKESGLTVPTDFVNDEEYQAYINEIKGLSQYQFDVAVGVQDQIITLCTCGNNTNYRILLHGKLVKK